MEGEGDRVRDAADGTAERIRCYMRDPDGYLIEVGLSTGLLQGHPPRNARRFSQA